MRAALFFLVLLAPVPSFATAERVTVNNTTVSFEPPAGFTMLTADQIGRKYAANNPPAQVVGNDGGTTSIAFELKPSPLLDGDLAQIRDVLATSLEGVIPGLNWIDRRLIDLQGKRWIYLEFTSSGLDTEIHNIMLATSLQDRALMFNFNSTKQEFPLVEKQLRLSLQSIRLDAQQPTCTSDSVPTVTSQPPLDAVLVVTRKLTPAADKHFSGVILTATEYRPYARLLVAVASDGTPADVRIPVLDGYESSGNRAVDKALITWARGVRFSPDPCKLLRSRSVTLPVDLPSHSPPST